MKTQQTAKKSGTLCMLAAGVMWSTAGMFVKYLSWSPLTIVCLRSLVAILPIMLYIRLRTGSWRLQVTRPVILAALCLMATMMLYISAIKLTIAANAIVLQYTAPVFIVIYTAWFARQRPRKLEIITCILVFAGIALFFFDEVGGGYWVGNLLGLLSGVAFGAVCYVNKLKGADPLAATALGNAGMILLLPLALTDGAVRTATAGEWGALLLLGVFQMAGGYLLFCEGIIRVPAFTAAIVATVEPILTPVWVYLTIGEQPGLLSLAGGSFVIAVIVVYNVILARQTAGVADGSG